MKNQEIFKNAAKAAQILKNEPVSKRNKFLSGLAEKLKDNMEMILAGNQKDLEKMTHENPLYDRLKLDEKRVEAIEDSLMEVAGMKDPLGIVLEEHDSSGLHLKKVTVPIGVIGIIYEARPNVTVDVAALCIKSGNVAVLKGGSDAYESNQVLVNLINEALQEAQLPVDSVLLLSPEREAAKELMQADKYVDVIIPRGGQGLIDFVRENSRVPVIETGAGVCHTYVDKSADIAKSAAVVVNAKVDRPSVCNALDTLLVHEDIVAEFLDACLPGLEKHNVKIFADEKSYDEIMTKYDQSLVKKATENSFGFEYLSMQMSVKVVGNLEEAIAHITKYSSKHSEAICAEDDEVARAFLERVDAAAVYRNTSTRFTDGGVFGLGAEIGISTQKLHARGPMGVRELTSYKWVIESDYAVR
ncbi:MAG: glutamate-5-semialdehyde dehydrogenase [Patescibacteria group bacterium]|nr:glutamate-5-semialdehyde dehydrogenase [Patescibacteria group bacterium]